MMMWKEKTFDEYLPKEIGSKDIGEQYSGEMWVAPYSYHKKNAKFTEGAVALDKIKWIDVPSIHAPILAALLVKGFFSSPWSIARAQSSNHTQSINIIPTLLWLHGKREHLFSYYQKQGQIRVRMASAPRQYLAANYSCRGIASSLRKHSRWVSDNFNDMWIKTYKKSLPIARWGNIQSDEKYTFDAIIQVMNKCDKGLKQCNKDKVKTMLKVVLDEKAAHMLKQLPHGSLHHSWGMPPKDITDELLESEFNIFPDGEELKMDMMEKVQLWKERQEEIENTVNSLLSVLTNAIDGVTE